MLKKLLLLALVAAFPAVAGAQSSMSLGPRFGVSIDPDQLVIGGQLSIAGLAENLTLDPSLEIGVLDNVTTIQFNFDGNYHFAIVGSDWRPALGLGIGIANYSFDRPRGDDSETEVGVNFILGTNIPVRSAEQWFAEMRFGVGDLPELKLIAGVNFRM